MSGDTTSRILIAGQAPGTRVHASGIPWNDKSGERLREWMQLEDDVFYDEKKIAIVPMGFCYPGKGKTGDLPPRKECAQLWHDRLMAEFKELDLILAIGQYAQAYHLGKARKKNLTETVRHFHEYGNVFPLPHPSPLNYRWQARNPWFVEDVLPVLRAKIASILT